MRSIFILAIALASILDAYGIPKRQPDPVTREVRECREGRRESTKWWFDITADENRDKAQWIIEAYAAARDWKEYTLDAEHPLYWMKGVLENRVANLHLMHNGATQMRVIANGDRTVYIGPRCSQKDRETLKKMI